METKYKEERDVVDGGKKSCKENLWSEKERRNIEEQNKSRAKMFICKTSYRSNYKRSVTKVVVETGPIKTSD